MVADFDIAEFEDAMSINPDEAKKRVSNRIILTIRKILFQELILRFKSCNLDSSS